MEKLCEKPSKYINSPWKNVLQPNSESIQPLPPDKPPDILEEQQSQNSHKSMKLSSKDLGMFGVCPALDDCILVICEQCGAVIKAQALVSHIERRHGAHMDSKTSTQHLSTASIQTKQKPPSKNSSKVKLKASPKSSPRNSPKLSNLNHLTSHKQSTNTSTANDCLGVNLLDKYKLPKQPASHTSNAVVSNVDKMHSALVKHLRAPSTLNQKHSKISSSVQPETGSSSTSKQKRPFDDSSASSSSEPPRKQTVKHTPVLTPKVTIPKLTIKKLHTSENGMMLTVSQKEETRANSPVLASPKPLELKPPVPLIESTKKLTTIDKNIPCKDRAYDPDRHCGCWLDEREFKHCTRSLTCKTHALSLRRRVTGRSKPFDQLLQEHREAKEALQQAKSHSQSIKPESVVTITSPSLPSVSTTTLKQASKTMTVSHNKAAVNNTPSVYDRIEMNDNNLASFEPETLNNTYLPFHPRPLGISTYNMRMCGSSLVPNRQYDYFRLALRYAIEQPRNLRRPATAPSLTRKSSSKKKKTSLVKTESQPNQPNTTSEPTLSRSLSDSTVSQQPLPSNKPQTSNKQPHTSMRQPQPSANKQSTLAGDVKLAGNIILPSQSAGAQLVRQAKMLQELSTSKGSTSAALHSLVSPQAVLMPADIQYKSTDSSVGQSNTLLLGDMPSKPHKLLQSSKGATLHLSAAASQLTNNKTNAMQTTTLLDGLQTAGGGQTLLALKPELITTSNGIIYKPNTAEKLNRSQTTFLLPQTTNNQSNLQYVRQNGITDSASSRQLTSPIHDQTASNTQKLSDTHHVLAMQLQQNKSLRNMPILTHSQISQQGSPSQLVANIIGYKSSS